MVLDGVVNSHLWYRGKLVTQDQLCIPLLLPHARHLSDSASPFECTNLSCCPAYSCLSQSRVLFISILSVSSHEAFSLYTRTTPTSPVLGVLVLLYSLLSPKIFNIYRLHDPLSVYQRLLTASSAAESVVQTDTVLTGFLEACIANPSQCLLAQDGISSQDLLEKVFQLLENVKYHPYLVNNDPVNGLIEYDTVKQPIFSALYRPVEWPSLAGVLHGIWTGNDTSIVENAQNASFLQGPVGTDSLLGIQCGDTTLPSQNFTALQPLIDATIATSRIAGDVIVALTPVTCAPWRFVAKEIYSGNFEAQTRTPILFVGGPFDPITPLVWALNMSAGFEGSVVLQHNGYGVSCLVQIYSLASLTNTDHP